MADEKYFVFMYGFCYVKPTLPVKDRSSSRNLNQLRVFNFPPTHTLQ